METLYDSIRDKTRVFERTGVASFSETENGVQVLTDNGKRVEGSILVGADGISSTIRLPAKYRALVGTSRNQFVENPKLPFLARGHMHNVYYEGISGFCVQGVQGLVFWCLFFKEEAWPDPRPASKFTDADCESVITKYGHLRLGTHYTFSDLWQSRVNASMTVMEEGMIEAPWNRGRVVLLGDSVHKLLPLLRRSVSQLPSREELAEAFARYEAKQRPRANICISMSNLAMRFETQDSWWLRLARRLVPSIPEGAWMPFFVEYITSAPRLDFLARESPVGRAHDLKSR
ncbi:hypothetical protein DL769_004714 [Monosporascus sp. CRB-8-3]|nr:hypothetical protein DL769_004714 [Monosporascus sp. CRB-8-3]